jgi:maltooligosyltrehalose trehalohydrolase
VNFIQNHDQIANSAGGQRCHALATPGRYRAMTALFILMPGTSMLFQGQEFAASSPFLFFADHNRELAKRIYKGRVEFLSQFPSIAQPDGAGSLPDPADLATFEKSKLDLSEREKHAEAYALHRDLLQLRHRDPVFASPRVQGMDGAVLGPEAFVLRFFGGKEGDRLLVVNFGRDLHLVPAPEPLLAPPEGKLWQTCWSSEDLRYGGNGSPPTQTDENWRVPGHTAVVLTAV